MRVGVVGCGYWGSKHVRVLSTLGEVEQVAAIDPRDEVCEGLIESFPGLRTFPNLEAAYGQVDAVILATPPKTHAPLGLQAIEAGMHVMIEKPLATSVDDAMRLIDAAESAGVTLMTGHTFEYNPAVWELRELVRGRELGDIFYVDAARLNLGLYQSDVNVVWDLAPHDVSIVNFLLGSAPTSVEAWGSCHAHARLEDVAYLRLLYEDLGVTAQVHVSWLDPCKVRRVTVVGSEKMAVYNDLKADERVRVYDKGVTPTDDDGPGVPLSYRYGGITSPYIEFEEPLILEDRHFVQSAIAGERPETDGDSGLAVVATLEAAERSMRSGRAEGVRSPRSVRQRALSAAG